MIKAVFFDFFRTIFDYSRDYERLSTIFRKIFLKYGITPKGKIKDDDLREIIDSVFRKAREIEESSIEQLPYHKMIKGAFKEVFGLELNDSDVYAIIDVTSKYSKFHPITDLKNMLQRIKDRGIYVGLISNTAVDWPIKVLKRYKIFHLFDVVLLSSEFGVRKPHPKIFFAALNKLGVSPEESIFVGDSIENDIVGANKVGMWTVWLRRGEYRALNELDSTYVKPDFIINNLDEIFDVIDEINFKRPFMKKIPLV
ncbi:MAG: HAD family hydrolase [Candidatus Asgardarchaeia archaeon]